LFCFSISQWTWPDAQPVMPRRTTTNANDIRAGRIHFDCVNWMILLRTFLLIFITVSLFRCFRERRVRKNICRNGPSFRGSARTQDYFLDSLAIAATSRTTTNTPINVQIHIPPPDHPFIHPSDWRIIKSL
jgi:hypothetical protein